MGHPGDWSFNVGGQVNAAPAVYSASFTQRSCNDRLFVASFGGGNNVFAFDNLYDSDANGPCVRVMDSRCTPSPSGHCPRLIWSKSIGAGVAWGAVGVDFAGTRVYLGSNDGKFAVLETPDGKTVNIHDSRVAIPDTTANYGIISPWVQPFGKVYIGVSTASDTTCRVYRFTPAGVLESFVNLAGALGSSPILWKGFLYVATYDGVVHKIEDGTALSEVTGNGWPINLGTGAASLVSSPSIDGSRDLLFISAGDQLFLINLVTLQRASVNLSNEDGTNRSASSPFVDGNTRYVYKGHEGRLWRVRYNTAGTAWQTPSSVDVNNGANGFPGGNDPHSTPIIFQPGMTPYVYIGDGGGRLNRFNADPMTQASRLTFPETGGVGNRIDSPVVVDYIGGNVYFGANNGRIYQISQTTLK
jgi:hypothetical protein